MTVFDIISMLGGLALFLYGMRMMGDGLKKGSSDVLRRVMESITNNPFKSFLLGLLITAVIQSSTATIVLTAGMVGAGIITLHQSLGIILGANVGTTVTGQIIRLMDIDASGASILNFFKPSTLAPLVAVIGILIIMAFKFRNSEVLGSTLMGFSILFTGLLGITSAVAPLSESEWMANIFTSMGNTPILGFLSGLIVATILQSSSSTVGLLQALSVTGTITFSSVYSILIGVFMGDCLTTALVCYIGGKADVKRTGLVHILFNICQGILIFIVITILHSTGVLDSLWSAPMDSGNIANVNTIFKLTCAVLLLPVTPIYEKMAKMIVKDDPESLQRNTKKRLQEELEALDKTFDSPSIALTTTHKAIDNMAALATANVFAALDLVQKYDPDKLKRLNDDEDFLDSMTDSISSCLIRLSPHVVAEEDSDKINYLLRCASEFEHIGDCAINISKSAVDLYERKRELSEVSQQQLDVIKELLAEILMYAKEAFVEQDLEAAFHIEPLEEVVDDLVGSLRKTHMQRLRNGNVSVTTSFVFVDVLINVERISDQCSNIGVHTIAQFDPNVAEMQHDYLRSLHHGEDAPFNDMFREARDRYMGQLAEIREDLLP